MAEKKKVVRAGRGESKFNGADTMRATRTLDGRLATTERTASNVPLERALSPFTEFAASLRIDTKDEGLQPLRLWGPQRAVLDAIRKALSTDKRSLVILKGRQMGISTLSLAFTLYWIQRFNGVQGALVSDSEPNRDFFRSVLTLYHQWLPKSWKIPITTHNRNALLLRNRSRLNYLVAGLKSGTNLGRSRPINFLHATELGSWGDPEAFQLLQATLSERYTNRFYLYESTANGYGMFYDVWKMAQHASTMETLFVGWWLMENYQLDPTSPQYKVYWDGHWTREERERAAEVKRLYGYTINPRQLAWYRWKEEEALGSHDLMMQEYPWHEEEAFIATGSRFFTTERLSASMAEAKEAEPMRYRYSFGASFADSSLVAMAKGRESLRIYEEAIEGETYVMGADPAYGSSDWGDAFAIEVYRCYSDGADQVAEYQTSDTSGYQFAWTIAHLAGYYRGAHVNLEVNGPGQAVFDELKRLRSQTEGKTSTGSSLRDLMGSIRFYLYRRPDSMGGGLAYLWKSAQAINRAAMIFYKDCYERGMLKIRSPHLLEEMRRVIDDGAGIHASGRGKDDTVFASMFALIAWRDWAQPALSANRYTRERAEERIRQLKEGGPSGPRSTVLGNAVLNYLKRNTSGPDKPAKVDSATWTNQ